MPRRNYPLIIVNDLPALRPRVRFVTRSRDRSCIGVGVVSLSQRPLRRALVALLLWASMYLRLGVAPCLRVLWSKQVGGYVRLKQRLDDGPRFGAKPNLPRASGVF